MWARTGTISFSPENTDDVINHVRETVIPMYEGQAGYKGFRLLIDHSNGKGLGVSYWDSEDAMRDTDSIGEQARKGAADAGGGSVEGVDRYEIIIDAS